MVLLTVLFRSHCFILVTVDLLNGCVLPMLGPGPCPQWSGSCSISGSMPSVIWIMLYIGHDSDHWGHGPQIKNTIQITNGMDPDIEHDSDHWWHCPRYRAWSRSLTAWTQWSESCSTSGSMLSVIWMVFYIWGPCPQWSGSCSISGVMSSVMWMVFYIQDPDLSDLHCVLYLGPYLQWSGLCSISRDPILGDRALIQEAIWYTMWSIVT